MSALRKLCELLSECTFFNLSVGSLHLFLVTLRAEFRVQHHLRKIMKRKMKGNPACKLLLLYSMQPFTGLSHCAKALQLHRRLILQKVIIIIVKLLY